jgi:5-hydroxyisourate hydrolase-like protein (transthyretin family)
LLAAIGAVLLWVAPASAAPYAVWSCQGPNGEAVPGAAWTPATTGAGATAGNDCATGMGASLPSAHGNSRGAGSLTFTAPAGTRITSYELARTLRATVGGLFSSGYVAGVASIDPAGPLGAGCSGSGLSASSVCSLGDPPLSATGVSLGGISLSAACTQDSCPAATPAAEATLARSRVTLEDPSPPTLSGTNGTIADSGRVVRTITVTGTDVGGGVVGISANVDGGSTVAVAGGGVCAAPFTTPQPCPATRAETFSVDTSSLRAGDHVATGTIVDAAGNPTGWGPVPFTVAAGSSDPGPAPAGATPIPVSPATTPAGSPSPTARLTLGGTTAKGRRVPTGLLRTQTGAPLSGVTVRLTRTRTGVEGARTVALKAVRTDRNGRFVSAGLPEGAWTVAASADVPGGTVSGSVRLRTALRTSATPSPTRLRTGGRMVLSGRLRGAGPAKSGVRVRIQVIVRGRYTTVATVRTDAAGRWRWRHRFTKVSRPTLFAFRAAVPTQGDGWPWRPIVRRATTVRVDPR